MHMLLPTATSPCPASSYYEPPVQAYMDRDFSASISQDLLIFKVIFLASPPDPDPDPVPDPGVGAGELASQSSIAARLSGAGTTIGGSTAIC